MEFKILGSVEAVDDRGKLSLGGPQQRRLLAILLCDPGRTLSYARLLDVLWPDGEPPENSRRTAISYVSRLRAALGEGWITTSDAGYSIDIDAASVDAVRFNALVDAARDMSPARAVDVLDEALALWRGPVLGDLHAEWWALPTVSRLEELRLTALTSRVDAMSAAGWDARALSEVKALVAAHPLRGPFVERLMRCLHAAGRADEALRVFQQHRDELIERTGLDPSPELVALDRSIAESGQQSADSEAPGRALRGYVLRDVIGEGSFGTVYRATQPVVGRDVAVKIVKPELADDRSFIRRFEAEAQTVARLEHPHIVPLYDFWREPGGAYLVFRLLRGGTGEQLLVRNGPFSLEHATQVVDQIGGALESAHAAGVVHRDIKPANILFDESGAAYLSDFGIATGSDRQPAGAAAAGSRMSAGSPMYASPEQSRDGTADARADQYALAATVWELLAGRAPFEGATVAEVTFAKMQSPLAALRAIRSDVPSRSDDVLRRASAVHPDDRFDSVADFVAAWHSATLASVTATTWPGSDTVADGPRIESVGATAQWLSGVVTNPYKGLRPFGEADAHEFFGRAALLGQLSDAVAAHHFVAVVGPSGSGKSSLVLAGLVPSMKRDGALVVTCTPGDDPFGALAGGFAELATAAQANSMTRDALRAPGGLVEAATMLGIEGQLVIVLDQLEELWTTSDDDDERIAFTGALAELVRSSARVSVVATIRADWFDRPLRDPSLGPLVARATFGVTPMQSSELFEAITDPAAKVGVRFEAGLVGRIVAEALDQPGSLPLLQFALTELFDRRSGSTIASHAYDEIGGLSGSVAHQANALFDTFNESEQAAVRRLFARLVNAGEGSEDTRRRARLGELAGVPQSIVTALVDRRLLTVDRDRETREPTIEIAHEALLRSWPRLREWLDEDRDWLRELRGLAGATRLWESSGRDQADLHRGARLAVVAEMSRTRTDSLTPDETEFVESSLQLADAERVAAEERSRLRELQNRRLRRSLAGLAVVVVAALIAGGVALVQSHRADQQSAEADAQRAAAETAASDADAQRAAAETAASDADTQRQAAEASAAEAQNAQRTSAVENLISTSILQRTNRQDLAALLAVEAYRIDKPKARSALFSTFTRNIGFMGYRTVPDITSISSLVVLPGNTTALAGVDHADLVRIDLETGQVLSTLDGLVVEGEPYFVTFLEVSADGRVAVYAVQGADSLEWRAYDVASGTPLAAQVTVPFAVDPSVSLDSTLFGGFGDASLNSDGSLLAVGGGSAGSVLVFDTMTGAVVGTAAVPVPNNWVIPAHTASVTFVPDGQLFVGAAGGDIHVFDPPSLEAGLHESRTIQGAKSSAENGIRYVRDVDGDFLITFGSSQLSRIDPISGVRAWTDLGGSDNSELEQPQQGLEPCRDLEVASVSPDKPARFYCSDDFGSIVERDVAKGAITGTLDRQTGVPGPLAFSRDHRTLVATSYGINTIATWHLDGSGPIQRMIATDTGSQAVFAYDPTSTYVLSGTSSNDAQLLNATTGASTALPPDYVVGTWNSKPNQIWSAFVEPDGRVIGRLYDVGTHSTVGPPVDFEGETPPYAVNDPLHHRMLLMFNFHVEVYSDEAVYLGPTIPVEAVANHDISAVWSTADGTGIGISQIQVGTRLFDATTGDKTGAAAPTLINSAVSPTGVGVGSTLDGRLFLFDPDTLVVGDELPGMHGFAENLHVSDDGTIVVAENEAGGERIFDVATRTQLGEPIPDVAGAVGYFAIRPDGKELAIPYADHGIALWDLEPEHWLDAACRVAGRNLTDDEWAKYLGDLGPYHQTCTDGKANR